MKTQLPFELLVGLDRSDAKADLCLLNTRTHRRRQLTLSTAPEVLATWLATWRQKHPQARLALCLEQPAGNLIAFFERYAFVTLYPINPMTLLKFREAFVTSRAKDDRQDAAYLVELLRVHLDKLTPWQPEDQPTRLLQQLVGQRRGVIDQRTARTNELQAILKQYFPQALDLCGEELWRPLATRFLLRWPTLQSVQSAEPKSVRAFYHAQGSRRPELIAARLKGLAQAIALTDDEALLTPYSLRVACICRQLEVLQDAVNTYDTQIEAAMAAHPDREIFRNLPGAGPVLAPRLLAACGSCRERFPQAAALQRYSGIAPVTKQSGNKRHVHRRYLCPKFLRQSFHEYAQESVLHSRWAAAYYLQQRQRGAAHHVAVRALAYKWQRIIWSCWHHRTIYKESQYETALRAAGSPLVALLDQVEVGKNPAKNPANKN